MSDAVDFIKNQYPALFARGVEILRERADAGDERADQAKAQLDDILAANGASLLRIDDEDIYLSVNDGAVTVHETAPDGVRMAFAVPGDALTEVFLEAGDNDLLEGDRAALRVARSVSKKLEDALADHVLEFHLIIGDAPDLGDVTVRIGLGVDEPPAEPKFTVNMKYDDLEAARESKMNPQQLFMAGKIKLGGDYSGAMQLAMQLMQQAQNS